MEIVKVLTGLTVMAFLSASAAFADESNNSLLSPANPNCSPGVKGCTANYPTADVSKSNPTSPYDPNGNPNCSPGQPGCSANYPTTDQSNANPNKPAPTH